MSSAYYAQQLQTARRRYNQSRDHSAYMADCLYVALTIGAAELAARDPRLKYLSGSLSAASYGVKGLIDMVAENLSCPIEQNDDHEDFLKSWYRHGKQFVDRDTQVVRDILSYMGVWQEQKKGSSSY